MASRTCGRGHRTGRSRSHGVAEAQGNSGWRSRKGRAVTEVDELARFAAGADYSQLSSEAVRQLKIRTLDTVGVASAALDAEPTVAVRALTERLGGNGTATLIGGGTSAPD